MNAPAGPGSAGSERDTIAVYQAHAARYAAERGTPPTERAAAFAAAVTATGLSGPRLDLGCGPGGHLATLATTPSGVPAPVIGADVAPAMAATARRTAAQAGLAVPTVCHDLTRLPFAAGSLSGVWACKSLQHVPHARLPRALAGIHRALAPGAPFHATVFDFPDDGGGDDRLPTTGSAPSFVSDDDFPGRAFWCWTPAQLATVAARAGFGAVDIAPVGHDQLHLTANRAEALPDIVDDNLRLLVVGLNPSWHAARAGYGFAGPNNRFWPCAMEAGVLSVARNPWHAVDLHRVGFTDLVKRPTAKASEVSRAEFRAGADELEALVRWLQPEVVCVVGLTGWRAARHSQAKAGWQPQPFGGRPVYLMPNPSGLNAGTSRSQLVEHFRAARRGPSNPAGAAISGGPGPH